MATSSHKGIYYKNDLKRRKRWNASVVIKNKYYFIGNFLTEQEAIEEYKKFIEKNKDSLSNNAKKLIKRQSNFPRNKDGLIERICSDCGKTSYFKKIPTFDHCQSCGMKESFKHRPGIGTKEINITSAYKDYKSGMSLENVSKNYGLSNEGLRYKFNKNGYKRRSRKEVSILISAKRQGINVNKWQKFITKDNVLIYLSPEYKKWRQYILKRDNCICQLCNQKGKHAHHIKTKAKRQDLVFDTNNGITLCKTCHGKIHYKEEQYEQFFLDLLCIKHRRSLYEPTNLLHGRRYIV